MNEVFWILECAIRPDQLENLRALMAEMVAATEDNEPGALNYEWYISAEETKCHIFERYADSAATRQHLSNFGKHYAKRFMAALEVKRQVVHGRPDADLKSSLGKMGAVVMEPLGGFTR